MEPAGESPRKPSRAQPAASFWLRHSHLVLAMIPFAGLVWLVARYGLDVPFWDQWDLVPLLDRMYAGHLSLSDVWAQHNEHRVLFPQLIMLGLARLTRWNIRWELAVNLALAAGVFLVLAWQIRVTRRTLSAPALRWAAPAASLIVFSLSQYQNWLWGWQIQMLLNLLAAVGGIVLLSAPPFNARKFAGAALLGIVATYSFANGVLFWPIGLGLLVLVTPGGKPRRASIAGWLVVSGLTVGAYLWHYQKPASHPPLNAFLQSPVAYVAYVLKYLGGLGAQYYSGPFPGQQAEAGLAVGVGLLGILALLWAGGTLLRARVPLARPFPAPVAADGSRRHLGRLRNAPAPVGDYAGSVNPLLPYFALAAYSIGTALLTGVGRVGMGSDEALESRYGTMAIPFWVSLVVLLLLLACDHDAAGQPPRHGRTSQHRKTAALISLMAALACLGASSFSATEGAANLSDVQDYCRTTLLDAARNPGAGKDFSDLISQGPYLKGLVDGYPVLVKHRLSLFREIETAR